MLQENIELKKFFDEIDLSDNSIDDIHKSFSETKITQTFEISGRNVDLYIDSGKYIFDSISTSETLFYIEFVDDKQKSLIKYNTNFDKDIIETSKDSSPNTLYLKYMINENVIDVEISMEQGLLSVTHSVYDSISTVIKTLNILVLKEKKTSSSGKFILSIKKFNETNFYFFNLFSSTFHQKFLENMVFLKETTSPRSMKSNLKFYFKDLSNNIQFSHMFTFSITKLIGTEYVIDYQCKYNSIELMKDYSILLQKYMIFFSNSENKNIENYIMDFYGLKQKYKIKEKAALNNKLNNLRKKIHDKSMIPSKEGVYSKHMCDCKHQPIIIDEEDKGDWQEFLRDYDKDKNEVISFPPDNSHSRFYTCPTEEFKYLTLKPNKGENAKRYPYLPCCRKQLDRGLDNLLKNYKEIKKEGKGPNVRISEKDLKSISIPQDLDVFLEGKFILEATNVSNRNSLISCLINASNSINVQNDDKSITAFRKNIEEYNININVIMQEAFGMNKSNLANMIKENNYLDTKIFFRYFEYLFNCHIFVFVNEGTRTFFETPRYKNFHIRNINVNAKKVLLFKDSNDRYSLLKEKGGFDYNKLYAKILPYYSISKDLSLVYENKYFGIIWEKILNSREVYSQKIDENGKCYAIDTKFNETMVTIYIPPSYPLNLPESAEIYVSNSKIVEQNMGKGELGKEGLWYYINKNREVFIPCNDIDDTSNVSCKQFIIDFNRDVNVEYNLHKIRISNSVNLVQIFIWIWRISNLTVDDFFQNHIKLTNNEYIFSENYINIVETSHTFDVKSAIEYIKNTNPTMYTVFDDSYIYIYEDLFDNIYKYMKKIESIYQYESIRLTKPLSDNVIKEYEILFKSRDMFSKWKGTELYEMSITDELKTDDKKYIFKYNNNFYIIMIFENKEEVIYVSEYWKLNKKLPDKIKKERNDNYILVDKSDLNVSGDIILDFSLQYGTFIRLI